MSKRHATWPRRAERARNKRRLAGLATIREGVARAHRAKISQLLARRSRRASAGKRNFYCPTDWPALSETAAMTALDARTWSPPSPGAICALVVATGLRQTELAQRLGIEPRRIRYWLDGRPGRQIRYLEWRALEELADHRRRPRR